LQIALDSHKISVYGNIKSLQNGWAFTSPGFGKFYLISFLAHSLSLIMRLLSLPQCTEASTTAGNLVTIFSAPVWINFFILNFDECLSFVLFLITIIEMHHLSCSFQWPQS